MLIERDEELADLARAAESALRGEGRLVLVEGAAGIGKTRLLDDARRVAAGAGTPVMAGAGRELEREYPFGVALQLFEPVLARLPQDERDALFAGAASLARPLFGGDWLAADGGEDAGFSLIHGLHWLASNAAQPGGLLMAVDDVHWADAPSMRFLLYLAQRIEELPIALVVSTRSGEPGGQPGLVGELAAHPSALLLRPQPLSGEGTTRLVRAGAPSADPSFCAACHEVTRGNPFLVRELLREVESSGQTPDERAAARVGEMAPRAVSLAAVAQIARLPHRSSLLARALAVLGDGAELRHAAALAAIDTGEAAAMLDALVAAEIVATEPHLRFVHPLIRTAVYEDIQPAERAAAHLRAARALLDEHSDPERTASHLLLSPRGGQAWVVEALRAAARHARGYGAPDSAAALLRRALDEPPPQDVRAEVLLELGDAETSAGEQAGLGHLEEAVDLIADRGRRAEVLFLLGRRLMGVGRIREATDAFDRGLAENDGGSAELHAQLVAGFVGAGRLDVSTRPRALEHLEALRQRPPDVAGSMERVLMGSLAFELATAGAPRGEVIDLATRALAGDALLGESNTDSMAFFSASTALGYADELEAAERALDASVADARRRGSVHRFARTSTFRSFVLYRMGRIDDAIADATSAIDAARYGAGAGGPGPHAVLSLALLDRGEAEAAEKALEIEDESLWSSTAPYAYFLEAWGRLRFEAGDAEQALAHFRACGELLEGLHAQNPALIAWRSWVALASARLGDTDGARELVDEELDLARRFGAPRAIGVALRARGLIEPRTQGIDFLAEAVDVLEGSPARLEHSRALVELGSALRRAGRRTEAREPLRLGLDGAHRSGALAVAERARDELVAAGGRPRRRELSGRGALTPSERRVARLAADGLTNREIAESLFVTLKTVQWHLGNSFRKLEVTSREELAGRLAEEA